MAVFIHSICIAIYGSLMRRVIIGITSSAITGGSVETAFRLPGIGVGCLFGLIEIWIFLLNHHFKKADKYKNILSKLTKEIIDNIEGNFTNIE